MLRIKQIMGAILTASIAMSMFTGFTTLDAQEVPEVQAVQVYTDVADDGAANENKVPKQVNVHMGNDPSKEVNVTYTTIELAASQIIINKAGESEEMIVEGESSVGSGNKYFHKMTVSGLEPNTNYEYTVGYGENTYSGTFKTALPSGSQESFKFVYLADTQVSNATNAKALGATLQEVNNMEDISFVYLAGDTTDTAANESQWEYLFYNDGAYPEGGQNMFGNNMVSVIQGNHDNNTLNRHIDAPAQSGNIVYSYDYGMATFIMLNLETARSDATARAQQMEFLKEKVADAKARGQWTIVGFHKSLYTGASHITDSDVVEARKYWAPVFAQLDVDMVLQGHDHVYSRGFVTEEGANANAAIDDDGRIINPANAPLYMVGGHAGGLKWYSKKNYTVSAGDPLTTGYSFLDVNSTDTGSDVNKEQVIVEMEISNSEFSIKTYMFKYDTSLDQITTEKYLYDEATVKRTVLAAEIDGTEQAVIDQNDEVTYTVSYDNINGSNAFSAQVSYDESLLEFVGAESLLDGTIYTDTYDENGVVEAFVGLQNPISSEEKTGVIQYTFRVKKDTTAESVQVALNRADAVQTTVVDGEIINSYDVRAEVVNGTAETGIYSYRRASDINKDGAVTLADLSLALGKYQTNDAKCDINLDGIVNIEDFIIITSYIRAA